MTLSSRVHRNVCIRKKLNNDGNVLHFLWKQWDNAVKLGKSVHRENIRKIHFLMEFNDGGKVWR